jgi:hypothetical protein
MTIANLNIGRQKYVVIPRKDFARLQRESDQLRRIEEEDMALGKLADRELRAFRKSGSHGKPWEQVKRELGL